MEQTLTTNLPEELKNWLSQPIPENLTEDEEDDFLIDSFFANFEMKNIKSDDEETLLSILI